MSAAPWVCGNCRSINQPREGRCYRCRTPRELVEADPDTLIVAGAGTHRPPEEIRPAAGYRSSAVWAFLTQALVLAGLAVTVVSSVLGADLVGRLLADEIAETETSFAVVGLLGFAGLGIGAAALVCWAVWLSRVVANVPAVGLGWPNLTPNQAIFESLIPGVNLYRVPAILRDVVNRLEPDGKGEAIIAAAWLGLVGGLLVPRALAFGIVFVVGSLEEFTTLRIMAGQLGLGLTIVGGLVLIYLISWIESRMAARAPDAGAVAAAPSAARPVVAPPQPAAPVPPTPSPTALAWAAEAPTADPEAADAPRTPAVGIGEIPSVAADATPVAPAAPAKTEAEPVPSEPAPAAPTASHEPDSTAPAAPTAPDGAASTAPEDADSTSASAPPMLAPTAHWTEAFRSSGGRPPGWPAPASDAPATADAPTEKPAKPAE